MLHKKVVMGICNIGHRIYLAGGYPSKSSCEVYNILSDKWSNLKADLPYSGQGITLVPAKKRYIYCFGGVKDTKSTIYALDTYKCKKDWKSINLKS